MRSVPRALWPFPGLSRHADGLERGETLIEIMVTVAVMGIGMVAILSGLWGLLRVGDVNSKASNADLVLRDYAETLKADGPTQIGSVTYDATYLPCTTLLTTGTYPAYTAPAPNASYPATITSIQYLDGYSGTSPVWRPQSQGCPPGGDQGLERLTLSVSNPSTDSAVHTKETVNIIKRNTAGES